MLSKYKARQRDYRINGQKGKKTDKGKGTGGKGRRANGEIVKGKG